MYHHVKSEKIWICSFRYTDRQIDGHSDYYRRCGALINHSLDTSNDNGIAFEPSSTNIIGDVSLLETANARLLDFDPNAII